MQVYFYSPIADTTLPNLNIYDDLIHQTKRGLEIWIHITYYMLKTHSKVIKPVLTSQIPDKGIIIFHKGFFPKNIKPNKNQYFICVQADYGRHRYAQMHLVQNPFQVSNFKYSKRTLFDNAFSFNSTYFITLWPQPSIKKRLSDRNNAIENISFYGNIQQVENGLEDKLTNFCNNNNLRYVPRYDSLSWNDYSNTDITLAIRSFTNNQYYHKPFSKLVNSLIAGCLVIAAPESSSLFFKEKYYPHLPIVNSFDELKNEIIKIQKDPDIYFEHLKKSTNNIVDLLEVGVIAQWEQMLFYAQKQFSLWQNAFSLNRALFLKYRSI